MNIQKRDRLEARLKKHRVADLASWLVAARPTADRLHVYPAVIAALEAAKPEAALLGYCRTATGEWSLHGLTLVQYDG